MLKKYNTLYKNDVVSNFYKYCNYKNYLKLPKILKIELNQGLGSKAQNEKILTKSIENLSLISGQYPLVIKTKQSIANFKLRENVKIGLKVTLRKNRMYVFFDKLINLILPRVRDFSGLSLKKFDDKGNFNFGIKDILIFPELEYQYENFYQGLNISIITTAEKKTDAIILLKSLKFPLIY
jgi:large subunit ribosomal protein L5